MAQAQAQQKNREAWLKKAYRLLLPLLHRAGAPRFPEPQLSVGIPSTRGLSSKKKTYGECWSEGTTQEGVGTIFITPILGSDDSLTVLGVLLHEMVHASVGVRQQHRHDFARVMQELGYTGKMTTAAAPPPNSALETAFKQIITKIGPFPNLKLTPRMRYTKTAATRLQKYICPECGMILRIAGKVGTIKCVETAKNPKNKRGYLDKPKRCGGIFRLCEDAKAAHTHDEMEQF